MYANVRVGETVVQHMCVSAHYTHTHRQLSDVTIQFQTGPNLRELDVAALCTRRGEGCAGTPLGDGAVDVSLPKTVAKQTVGEAPVMFFGKKSASADNTSESKPCCASKSKEPHTHAPAEKATVTAKPSIFEFFSSASGDDRDGDARAMLGHCTAVEGGLNACVWVPTNERQHKIVF